MTSAANLPILCDFEGPVARRGTCSVARGLFLAEIEELAQRLPDQPFVVNFCTDRYQFVVAWFAAMSRAQVTLLPSTGDATAVADLQADYPALYVLTDDGRPTSFAAPTFAYPILCPAGPVCGVPAFPPDQVAAVLFTSGSTGRPQPSPRCWGRLVAGSLAAGIALGVEHLRGSAVIATVPHAHSYGLESAVMLPLQHGLLLTAERPFFPADVAAALHRDPEPGILVTAPVHLRALAGDAAGPGFGTSLRAGFVLSATASLTADLAAHIEAAFSAPVFEIYGCSEAGQLATRRTIEGPVWRSLKGFRVYNDDARCWATGPHEADARLADEIELIDRNRFILQGRTADLVNIAGKRSSISYLTSQLLEIEGVQDGAFLMPDEGTAGATPRLMAVAVAPGLDAASILRHLRTRVDTAFLPRPLLVVDALPRDDLGKLPRERILRLIKPSQTPPEALPPAPVTHVFPANHPTVPGHFPGNPIVPGAVMLDELVHALFPDGWYGQVDVAKFHHPVRPGDTVQITRTAAGGSIRFECHLAPTRQLVLSGVLRSSFPSR